MKSDFRQVSAFRYSPPTKTLIHEELVHTADPLDSHIQEAPNLWATRTFNPRPTVTNLMRSLHGVHDTSLLAAILWQFYDFANGNGAALVAQCEAPQLRHVAEELHADGLLHCELHDCHAVALDELRLQPDKSRES